MPRRSVLPLAAAGALGLALLAAPGPPPAAQTARPLPGRVALPARSPAVRADRVAFRHLRTTDGLSSAKVTAVAQDRLGFIWIGTIDGLNRYDGYEVREFRHVDDAPASLAANEVEVLLPAHDGALWVGTAGGGLDRYDPATEAFTHHRAGRGAGALPSDEVLALAEDDDGRIWVGTTRGLARLDPTDGSVVRFRADPRDPRALPHDEVRALRFDAAGTLWVGTRDGLARLDPGSAAFAVYRDAEPAGRAVAAVHPREAGGLWVGTWGAGLRVLDPRTGTFAPVPLSDDIGASIISALYQDRQGTLWVGTTGAGLFELPAGGAPVAHRSREGDAASLADDAVSAVMQDRQGVLWVGTFGGLDRFDRARGLFRLIRRDPEDPATLPANNVRAVLAARGALWVGTDRGLARALDSTLTRFGLLPLTREGGAGAAIHTLLQDDDGTLWIGTGGGLDRLDARTRRVVHLEPGRSLESLVVNALADGPAGRLWVGTNDGLYALDRRSGAFAPFRPAPGRPTALPAARVRALAVVGGALWVGTAGGLARLDAAGGGGRFSVLRHDPGDARSLCGNEVVALHARPDGTLWVGTNGGGLCRLDTRRPAGGFERYTEAETELPSDAVRAIAEDQAGFLWVSTSRSLVRMDPVTGAFRPFDTGAGEFNPGAAARGPDGTVYVGSSTGLLVFAPGRADDVNPNPPEVVLTAVRLFNEPLAPAEDGPLARAAPVAEEVVLDYDEDVVTFEFAAIHFSDPARNTYAYRLDGFDEEWVEVGTQRTATYTSLSPGRYTFRVKAASADGIWSEHEATIGLAVRSPWWRTPWAYLLYALLLGAAAAGVDRVQRTRVRRQERERAVRAEAELRAVMAETESRALKAEAERLKAEDERKAAELARQEAELQRARENEQKTQEIARAYDALEASVRDLRATQAQLIQAEKLASLGALTAGIAHEIKNPLNFVNNFAELSVDLADELEAELRARAGQPVEGALPELVELLADLRDNARRIHEHGRRADRIVKNMLSHSRGGAGERVRTDVSRFVDEYANLAYHGMKAKETALNVALQRDFDPEAGTADVVPQELGRVLINLLNNAFYAVGERARREGPAYLPTVTVATRRLPGADGQPDRVAVRIADNGPGIPREVRARIFEPFFTTKPTGEGTGLGLSLAYEIVTQGHGGTLEVESAEGEGAAFTLTLPAAPAGAAPDDDGAAEEQPEGSRAGAAGPR